MEPIYTSRYKGTRWTIIYGSYEGVERQAVNDLQKMIQSYLPYIVEILPAEQEIAEKQEHLILIGTPYSNRHIAALLSSRADLPLPQQPQGYLLSVTNSPYQSGKRSMLVAGSDDRGTLYAVQELCKWITAQIPTDSVSAPVDLASLRQKLDSLPDFCLSDYPRVENRGIWTWGYVIHDYRGFLDHLAHLKMNLLIAWNDFPPLNFSQVAEYAHARGIRVVLGFHWGWGIPDLVVTNPEHQQIIKKTVLKKFNQYYRNLDLDGIYFQTLTEHNDTIINGQSVAGAACHMVNEISAALFELKPDLRIYFGLHATSIREHYPDLSGLDPRVAIIWEDAGGIPYAYDPNAEAAASIEKTIQYSKELAVFRTGTEFAMVPKGWSALRWETEFEHHGHFILGEQNKKVNRARLLERQPRWERINALWFRYYPLAARFYREVLDCKPPCVTAAGLVEDDFFEEVIQPSVALFAETLWNPYRSDEEILKQALNGYYYLP